MLHISRTFRLQNLSSSRESRGIMHLRRRRGYCGVDSFKWTQYSIPLDNVLFVKLSAFSRCPPSLFRATISPILTLTTVGLTKKNGTIILRGNVVEHRGLYEFVAIHPPSSAQECTTRERSVHSRTPEPKPGIRGLTVTNALSSTWSKIARLNA